MDNLVWAELKIRELLERVERLERLSNYKDVRPSESAYDALRTERILEEFEVPRDGNRIGG